MKALIIEDEIVAAKALQKLLGEVSPDTEIVGVIESVEDGVEWLENNSMPDIMFLDIHKNRLLPSPPKNNLAVNC